VHAYDALRVSLDDLRSADTKGKWWLVGAAWAGDPLVDKQTDARMQSMENSNKDSAGEQLLMLAKKQGMNTDIRRSIFVVVMSSDVRRFFLKIITHVF
jgi:nucleolar MIF4G domain-containing protein 1